jgi:hypothetical protein
VNGSSYIEFACSIKHRYRYSQSFVWNIYKSIMNFWLWNSLNSFALMNYGVTDLTADVCSNHFVRENAYLTRLNFNGFVWPGSVSNKTIYGSDVTGWRNIHALVVAGLIPHKLDLWHHALTKLCRTHGNPDVTLSLPQTRMKYNICREIKLKLIELITCTLLTEDVSHLVIHVQNAN